MSTEENKLVGRRFLKEILNNGNLAVSDELGAEVEDEAPERKIFGLVLAIATEPPKLVQARQMLVHLQKQSALPEDFSSWAIKQLDERVMSMALKYAHDAEILVQMLSFKGGTLDGLIQTIEELYQHEQISQRVYVKAKLLLRANETPKPEKPSREGQQQQADGSHSTASPG
jgi:hypothetical protein